MVGDIIADSRATSPGIRTVVRRWQRLTDRSAQHAVSGRGFDDLADEAEAADATR